MFLWIILYRSVMWHGLLSNKNSSPLKVWFIFTRVLILWSNPSCSIYISPVTKSSQFCSRLSGTALSYPCFLLLPSATFCPLLLPTTSPPIKCAGSPHLRGRGGSFPNPLQHLQSKSPHPIHWSDLFTPWCSTTFTSFALSQGEVTTSYSEKPSVCLLHFFPAVSVLPHR